MRSTWRNRRALGEQALFSRLSSSPSSLRLLHSTLSEPSRRARTLPPHPPPPPLFHATATLPPPRTHTHTRGANGHSHSPEDCSSLPPTPTWCLCYFLQATTPFWLGRRRLYCAGRRRFDSNVMQGERFNPVSTLFRIVREGGRKQVCCWSLKFCWFGET